MKRTLRAGAAIHGTTVRHGARLLGLISVLSVLLTAPGCGGGGGSTGSPPANPIPAGVGSATLSWEKPATNQDGTPLTDLAGYQIYYSQTTPVTTADSQLISVLNPNQISYVVAGLAPGTYHFAVTAVNLQGSESPMSNEAIKTVD
ncbi:MAG: fibronectin type III domain-containing protein [Nitrospirota bacterium]